MHANANSGPRSPMGSADAPWSASGAPLPADYRERVYAGILGKVIGVYLGGPIEDWTYERIIRDLGEIWYYVNDRLGIPLVVPDDDISGTFTFFRAIRDNGYRGTVSAREIGQSWLNYLIEDRTVLWWGGLGNSTEHTAYLRLKAGIPAPESGSIARNGRVVAEQIGAQIFIDSWAMLAPGDAQGAANLARRAASVSHDGVALDAAAALAAMEAMAFVESDLDKLLDVGASVVPPESIVRGLIRDLRAWRTSEPDWTKCRDRIEATYGARFGMNAHIIPNFALILLGVLYGDGDFQKTLMVVNSAGWDTDCNSGNAGCLMGIRNGLAGLDAGPDWRGPVADRMYLPTAEGGRVITDAVRETDFLVSTARRMRGLDEIRPKAGAQFHFNLPGSVQGFQPDGALDASGTTRVANVAGHSGDGERSLAVEFSHLAPGRYARALTATFIPRSEPGTRTYNVMASPSIYPGQSVRMRVEADTANLGPVVVRIVARYYGPDDLLSLMKGPEASLEPSEDVELDWTMPDLGGQPIAEIGLELEAAEGRSPGTVYLDWLRWDGPPDVHFAKPAMPGTMWHRAWVSAVDHWPVRVPSDPAAYGIIQDAGTGLLIQGARDWSDYSTKATVRLHLGRAGGIAARVQGLTRWYGLLVYPSGEVRLTRNVDGATTLAERQMHLDATQSHSLRLDVHGTQLRAWVDGAQVFELEDMGSPLDGGAVALVCTEGRLDCAAFEVRPLTEAHSDSAERSGVAGVAS